MNEISPYVRVAMECGFSSGQVLNERVIFDYELFLVKEGKIKVMIDDTQYIGIPGDIFIFRPKVKHSFEVISEETFIQPHIHFDMVYTEKSKEKPVNFVPLEAVTPEQMAFFETDFLKILYENCPDHIRLANSDHVENLIYKMISEHSRGLPFFEMKLRSLCLDLLVYILRKIQLGEAQVNNANYDNLLRAKIYIADNCKKNLTLDEIANVANLSKHYFSKLFAISFGTTPLRFHTDVKLEKAKDMLLGTNLGMAEIAKEIGFWDSTTFIRAFKAKFGVSPGQYKKQVL